MEEVSHSSHHKVSLFGYSFAKTVSLKMDLKVAATEVSSMNQ